MGARDSEQAERCWRCDYPVGDARVCPECGGACGGDERALKPSAAARLAFLTGAASIFLTPIVAVAVSPLAGQAAWNWAVGGGVSLACAIWSAGTLFTHHRERWQSPRDPTLVGTGCVLAIFGATSGVMGLAAGLVF